MILGYSSPEQMAAASAAGRATLDDMFRRSVTRHPETLALCDPPNRESFTDGAPLSLTFAEADRIVSAIAARLRRLGLQTDQVVALQLPNTVESVLTLLGVLRAGLIAAPMPLLWRRTEAVAALSRVGASALVTCRRIGKADHADIARHVAAGIFPMRHVCAFGRELPDGIVPLDEVLSVEKPGPLTMIERSVNPAAHLAVITWEVTAAGPAPVARSHLELIAAGLSIVLESRMQPRTGILSTLGISSLAGLATGALAWLVLGGSLSLHHPLDLACLAGQIEDQCCRTVAVPGAVACRLADAGLLSRANGVHAVLAAWRAPERVAASAPWGDSAHLIDIHAFGETALLPLRRTVSGKPAAITLGSLTAPRGTPGAALVAEIARTEAGTVALRGPMAPRFPYPPGAALSDGPCMQVDAGGFVDTGYPCRIGRDSGAVILTGPPAGVITVGGHRLGANELQTLVAEVDPGATLAALPDLLAGQRLAGQAADRAAIRRELAERGVCPLIVNAFRDRRSDRADAA